MSTPQSPTPGSQSPGWYASPDGLGQQWWNGASWSDARRSADGSNPVLGGLPGYQAAPPPGNLGATIPVPPPVAGVSSGPSGTAGAWIVPLVFSLCGFFVFNLFAVFSLVFGVIAFRSSTPLGKILSGIAIVISIAAIVSGVLSFMRGERSIEDIVF